MKNTLFLVLGVAMLAGCTASELTGRGQYTFGVTEQQAINESAAAYSTLTAELAKKRQIESGTPRAQKLREITDKLIAQAVRFRADTALWRWEVELINDPKTVNAWCMAGGKMAMYTGLIEQLKATDDEIAQVMGHEIGHALANHSQERMARAQSIGLGRAALGIFTASSQSGQAVLSVTDQVAPLWLTLPNSREGESEADQIGIELAARAGYDPRAAVTLWEKMGRLGGKQPEFLSTHPSPATRSAELKALGPRVEPFYQRARANPERTPSFLDAKTPRAEREAYAQKVSSEPDVMTFLQERFELYKNGRVMLDCRTQCLVGYTSKRGDWKKMHDRKQWRDLAVSVMQTGYLSDHSYFLLAEAAEGMGLKSAAGIYYRRAIDAGREYGCGSNCDGFDVQRRSHAALMKPI